VRIYQKSFVAAGFKVISQTVADINVTPATLRIRFLKKNSKFYQDLEYKFTFTSRRGSTTNACGSISDSRELSVEDSADVAEAIDYIRTFEKVHQKVMNDIDKEISIRK
jgi:hypothetical protein